MTTLDVSFGHEVPVVFRLVEGKLTSKVVISFLPNVNENNGCLRSFWSKFFVSTCTRFLSSFTAEAPNTAYNILTSIKLAAMM
jgi:hypothetical protein